jgi:hypothetical protein
MANYLNIRVFIVAIVLTITTIPLFGNPGKPSFLKQSVHPILTMVAVSDTLPVDKAVAKEHAEKNQEEPIKEVPKSRKQTAPIAVPAIVTAKPIKIVKPKIIKPIIKIN